MAKYVLAKTYSRAYTLFLCSGPVDGTKVYFPFYPDFDFDVQKAVPFQSVERAKAARVRMSHVLGKYDPFKVHEVKDDGSVVQVEP